VLHSYPRFWDAAAERIVVAWVMRGCPVPYMVAHKLQSNQFDPPESQSRCAMFATKPHIQSAATLVQTALRLQCVRTFAQGVWAYMCPITTYLSV
jgi:hypothetical protein